MSQAMNLDKQKSNDQRLAALTAIAGISAMKIPEGKKPVSPELLDKMQKHYHKLRKKHVLWSHAQLQKATAGFFGVEIVEDQPNPDAE